MVSPLLMSIIFAAVPGVGQVDRVGPAQGDVADPGAGTEDRAVADRKLLEVLEELDRRVATIRDLTAIIEDRKTLSMLKKPLVSMGRVRVRGNDARWEMEKPHRSITVLGDGDLRVYYPEQRTMEVYKLDDAPDAGRLMGLLPLPRLRVLREYFTLEEEPVRAFGTDLDDDKYLALRMRPIARPLRDQLGVVEVLIDRRLACVVRAAITDSGGDRTSIVFTNIAINTGLSAEDVELVVPPDTTIVHPLSRRRSETPRNGSGAAP